MTSFWFGFGAGVCAGITGVAGLIVLLASLSYTRAAMPPPPPIFPREPQ